jgi:hypothetical protein
VEAGSRHTRTDHMVGTVAYMAPERFVTDRPMVSPASDVFAWGVVVTYAGTGRTPFDADSPAATAASILTQPPRLDGLHPPLRDLVERALAKDPADRPTAHELLDMLLTADTSELAGRPELREAAEAMRGRTQRRRRLPIWLAAGAAALVLGLAAIPLIVRATNEDGVPPRVPVFAVRGPTILDRLDRPGQWQSADGHCYFVGALVVELGDAGAYQCPGPKDTFAGDQSIAVDISLNGVGACAQIWFRAVKQSSYLLSACPARVVLALDSGGTRTLASAPAKLYPPGGSHRLIIDIRDDQAAVTVDGAPAVTAALGDPALSAGQIALGAVVTGAGGQGQVSFANAEIRSQ